MLHVIPAISSAVFCEFFTLYDIRQMEKKNVALVL